MENFKETVLEIDLILKPYNISIIDGGSAFSIWRDENPDSNFDVELVTKQDLIYGCTNVMTNEEIFNDLLNNEDVTTDGMELFHDFLIDFERIGFKFNGVNEFCTIAEMEKENMFLDLILIR